MVLIAATLALFLFLWLFFVPVGPIVQRVLAALGHRTAAFRYRDYLPVAVLLAVGLGATILIGDEFLDLAESMQRENEAVRRADRYMHDWARSQRSTTATAFFTFFTIVGTPVGLGLLVAVVAALLIARKRFRWAAFLVLTSGIGSLIVVQLKIFFARARPDLAEALRTADGYSFPSGHAMGSTVVFGALSYLVLRMSVPWPKRAAGLAASGAIIAAISISRVYLGVHWISDIGAGIAAGTVWVVVSTVAYETFRRIRLVRELRQRRAAEISAPGVPRDPAARR